jgi:hypothetical protein
LFPTIVDAGGCVVVQVEPLVQLMLLLTVWPLCVSVVVVPFSVVCCDDVQVPDVLQSLCTVFCWVLPLPWSLSC